METQTLTAEFNDFIIQQRTYISIVPLFEMDGLKFISVSKQFWLNNKGDFGPFRPNKLVRVPLWLAVYLKKLSKCRI